jgi:hypothetical protein
LKPLWTGNCKALATAVGPHPPFGPRVGPASGAPPPGAAVGDEVGLGLAVGVEVGLGLAEGEGDGDGAGGGDADGADDGVGLSEGVEEAAGAVGVGAAAGGRAVPPPPPPPQEASAAARAGMAARLNLCRGAFPRMGLDAPHENGANARTSSRVIGSSPSLRFSGGEGRRKV